MIEGKNYSYMRISNWLCLVYNKSSLLGSVHIDNSGAWNVKYIDGTKYLPINSCLKILEYGEIDYSNVEIE